MKYTQHNIVFQEVPGEISLSLSISGCPLRCDDCHSAHLRNSKIGNDLTNDVLLDLIKKYDGMISCVLFMGGEWHQDQLIEKLSMIESHGLKTALYTGLESVDDEIKNHLNFIKLGAYDRIKGGLSSPTTNQIFLDIKNNKKLNHLFTT